MSRIKSKDMAPEMAVRRLLYSMGFRYRLHAKDLPGKPDIIFRGKRKAIFVHGCFWHQHPDPGCPRTHAPKSRLEYWGPKLKRNTERDQANQKALEAMGWSVLIVWECELADLELVSTKLLDFMSTKDKKHN